jgi:hypothetical protein
MSSGPLTPKEFAAVEFGGARSARWVRKQCWLYLSTNGRAGIPVISGSRPYLIPRAALGIAGRSLGLGKRRRAA